MRERRAAPSYLIPLGGRTTTQGVGLGALYGARETGRTLVDVPNYRGTRQPVDNAMGW